MYPLENKCMFKQHLVNLLLFQRQRHGWSSLVQVKLEDCDHFYTFYKLVVWNYHSFTQDWRFLNVTEQQEKYDGCWRWVEIKWAFSQVCPLLIRRDTNTNTNTNTNSGEQVAGYQKKLLSMKGTSYITVEGGGKFCHILTMIMAEPMLRTILMTKMVI